jgi:hypothetical protein
VVAAVDAQTRLWNRMDGNMKDKTEPPTETERLHDQNKVDADGKMLFNQYDCRDCLKAGIPHEVKYVPHGQTDAHSDWGAGIPTDRLECSGCKRWNGPWVSADIVGGGW